MSSNRGPLLFAVFTVELEDLNRVVTTITNLHLGKEVDQLAEQLNAAAGDRVNLLRQEELELHAASSSSINQVWDGEDDGDTDGATSGITQAAGSQELQELTEPVPDRLEGESALQWRWRLAKRKLIGAKAAAKRLRLLEKEAFAAFDAVFDTKESRQMLESTGSSWPRLVANRRRELEVLEKYRAQYNCLRVEMDRVKEKVEKEAREQRIRAVMQNIF